MLGKRSADEVEAFMHGRLNVNMVVREQEENQRKQKSSVVGK